MSDARLMAHHRMRAALACYGRRFGELTDGERPGAERYARKSLEVEAAVLASPEATGIVLSDAVIDRAMADVAGRYDGAGDLARDLGANGLSLDGLRLALVRELIVEAVLARVAAAAPAVSEAEVRAWYDAHPQRFRLPETRTVRHILVTVNAAIAENTFAAARRRIDALHAELAGGCRFADLAGRHSECPSALDGGRLGRVARGKLFAELDDVLFGLDEGAIGPVTETEAGFHIVLCEKIHPPEVLPFDDVAAEIRRKMTEKRRERAQKHWLSALLGDRAAGSGNGRRAERTG